MLGCTGVVGSRGVIGTRRRGDAATSLAVITLAGDGPGGSVAVTVAVLGVFAGDVAVLLALLGELGVVLVGVQVAFQLLGAALLLGGGVALLLLLAEGLELALQGVVARTGLVVGF